MSESLGVAERHGWINGDNVSAKKSPTFAGHSDMHAVNSTMSHDEGHDLTCLMQRRSALAVVERINAKALKWRRGGWLLSAPSAVCLNPLHDVTAHNVLNERKRS